MKYYDVKRNYTIYIHTAPELHIGKHVFYLINIPFQIYQPEF